MRKLFWIGISLFVSVTAAGQAIDVTDAYAPEPGMNPRVEEYIVEKGDTLWDICEAMVGDPFLWPKVWSFNPEIQNPHWIYPGDLVRFFPPSIDLLPTTADLVAGNWPMPGQTDQASRPGRVDEIEGQENPDEMANRVEEIAVESVMLGVSTRARGQLVSLFVTRKEMQETGRLTNAKPDKILLSVGDDVFVHFKDSDQRPAKGERLILFRTEGEVEDPDEGDHMGYLTRITGIARVIRVKEDQSLAEARITNAFAEIERGQGVVKLEEEPWVALNEVPSQVKVEGKVLAVRNTASTFAGDNEVVFIDKGTQDGLAAGNRLNVFASGDGFLLMEEDVPSYPIAILHVVDAREDRATCVVLRSRREIRAGARVASVTR